MSSAGEEASHGTVWMYQLYSSVPRSSTERLQGWARLKRRLRHLHHLGMFMFVSSWLGLGLVEALHLAQTP